MCRMARELVGGESVCGIFPTVLSVSILPSFIHPSHRAPIQARDFLVQTQLGFDSPGVIRDAEMLHEWSEMGVGVSEAKDGVRSQDAVRITASTL